MVRVYKPQEGYFELSKSERNLLAKDRDLTSAYTREDLEEVSLVLLDGVETITEFTLIWLSDGWFMLDRQLPVNFLSLEGEILRLETRETVKPTRFVYIEEASPNLFFVSEFDVVYHRRYYSELIGYTAVVLDSATHRTSICGQDWEYADFEEKEGVLISNLRAKGEGVHRYTLRELLSAFR